jgi:uncharacterized membrane protein YphA (DoxX/SURF4 family)
VSIPTEQLEREKTRAVVIAVLELVLGVTMLYVGLQVLSISEAWRFTLYQMQQYAPAETMQMYEAALGILIALGFFALIHGIKRIADNLLNAWVKSAIPKAST